MNLLFNVSCCSRGYDITCALSMTDTPLTADGVFEARMAGKLMAENRIEIDEVYTSLLRRSTKVIISESYVSQACR